VLLNNPLTAFSARTETNALAATSGTFTMLLACSEVGAE